MSTHADRIAILEARIAELERRGTRPMRLTRRLAMLVLATALMLPAGAVLASHQFSDVPSSHQFHGSISAIADAGITTGCGGGRFCPNGLVTRGQMAAFLNRLGALSPGMAPKVNADKVDGFHGTQLLLGTGTIPPGTTITGAEEWMETIIGDNDVFRRTVLFPARAPSNLLSTTVNFSLSLHAIDVDTSCTGSAAAPSAPPGKVCIYLQTATGADSFAGNALALPGHGDRGFTIAGLTSGAAGATMTVRYTWAYTAPTG